MTQHWMMFVLLVCIGEGQIMTNEENSSMSAVENFMYIIIVRWQIRTTTTNPRLVSNYRGEMDRTSAPPELDSLHHYYIIYHIT